MGAVLWVYHSIKQRGYDEAVAVWQPKYSALDTQFTNFAASVKAEAEKAEAEKLRKEKEDRDYNAKRKVEHAAEIARARADGVALAARVREHYLGAGGGGSGAVPGVSAVPDGSGPGAADAVFAQLAADAAETTVMFNECRARWKAAAAR